MRHEQIDALQQPELQRLATEINTEHAEVENTLRAGLAHALHCGELLIAAKKLVPHGEWLPWLAANCTASERTAQAYIRLASHRAELEEKSATRCGFEDLSFRQGLKLLAEPTKESWARPDSQYIPTAGHLLCGYRHNTEVFIAHAEKHPGYCYVVRLDTPSTAEGGCAVECSKRGIRNDYIEAALDLMRVHVDLYAWEAVPSAPWPYCLYWIPE